MATQNDKLRALVKAELDKDLQAVLDEKSVDTDYGMALQVQDVRNERKFIEIQSQCWERLKHIR